MKQKCFFAILVGAAAVSGCSIDAPLDLGVRCGAETGGIAYIVSKNEACKSADDENCDRFADAFSNSMCPAGFYCLEDEDKQSFCSAINCSTKEHEYNGQCEPNSIAHCGQHGYDCYYNTPGWVSGECESTLMSAVCTPSKCESGYDLSNGKCTARVKCDSDYHLYNGDCEPDDVKNCGRHGFDCASNTAGWISGTCTEAKCIAEECDKGYKEIDGVCTALIDCPTSKHIYNGECEHDDMSNCGMHGNDCTKIAGWKDGTCENATCFATACQTNYELKEDAGVCRIETLSCEDTEHLYAGDCEKNTVNNCGSHGYDCLSNNSGWVSGTCPKGQCIASECADGYKLENGTCVTIVQCKTNEHYSNGDCLPDDINNCGMESFSCKDGVTGWADGDCVEGKCVASSCEAGYRLDDNKCAANINCDPGQHIYNGVCENDDIANCGKHESQCSANAGWESGDCVDSVCIAESCQIGYTLKDSKCVALTNCGEGKHLFNGTCEDDDIQNCGMHGNDCTTNASWGTGSCTDGKCSPDSCAKGYHFNASKVCVGDDNNNCGSIGKKCTGGTVCSGGTCTSNCQAGESLCTSSDGSTACIDPKTSPKFCNANADCSSYTICTDSQSCIDGKCVTNSCSSGTQLCTISGENTCINVTATNAGHCGACNYKCADHPLTGATSNSCKAGKCQYTCSAGYKNCGSAETPNCILESNLKTDSNNCGVCGKQCSSNEYCYEGSCVTSKCAASNQCADATTGACVSTATQCGTQCINCKTANNAADGTCSSGTCAITKCAQGYHLSGSGTSAKCVANTATACGTVSSTSTKNCTTTSNATDGYCNEKGSCVATSCKLGFHISGTSCVADSTTACGATSQNCEILDGWNGGTCTSGVCQASKCQSGYCLSGTTCVNGASNAQACGTSGGACSVCNTSSNEACMSGKCSTNPCNSTTCYYSGSKCENTNTHCGVSCIDCTTANNAAGGTCNSGKCSITSCAIGYHLSGSSGSYSCVKNTDTACGATNSTTTTNCNTANNAASGTCSVSGTCTITSCKTGHIYNNTCEANTTTNCLAHGVTCGTNQTCSSTGCTCKTGYHMSGTTCVSDKTFCEGGYTNVSYNGINYRAYCIQTADDFVKLAETINAGQKYPSDFSGSAYVLTNDIDLGTRSKWYGVGNSVKRFTYPFLGNNHKISGNLTCASEDCGLFAYPYDTIIADLISNVNITTEYQKTGGIVGNLDWSMIKNCKFTGTLKSSTGDAGGICGIAQNSATIDSCSVTADSITCSGKNCGGIAGSAATSTQIIDSTVNTNINNPGSYTGGIVGSASENVIIKNCSVIGPIMSGNTNGGGIAGAFDTGSILSSSFSGAISGTGVIGGLVGKANQLTVNSCYVIAYLYALSASGGLFGNATSVSVYYSAIFANVYGVMAGASHGGTFSSASNVSISNTAIFADVTNSSKCGLLGPTSSNVTFSNIFTDGTFNNCSSDTSTNIIPSSSYIITNHYASENALAKATKTYGTPLKVTYDSRTAMYNSAELATTLNKNDTSTKWETRNCVIPYGVSERGMPYRIPLPNSLPALNICY